MVLIFSTPCRTASASKSETMRLSMSTVALAPSRRVRATKPEMSANITAASSMLSAISAPGLAFRRSTMASGSTLRNTASVSALACSARLKA